MLRISGYDVIFPHNLRLLDVVSRLRQWCSRAALRLTRRNTSCKQRTLGGYGHPVGRTSIWRRLLIGRRRVHRARHRITSARRLPILNVLEEGRYHSPLLLSVGLWSPLTRRKSLFQYFHVDGPCKRARHGIYAHSWLSCSGTMDTNPTCPSWHHRVERAENRVSGALSGGYIYRNRHERWADISPLTLRSHVLRVGRLHLQALCKIFKKP